MYQTKYTNNKSSVCHVINRWQIKRPSIFLLNSLSIIQCTYNVHIPRIHRNYIMEYQLSHNLFNIVKYFLTLPNTTQISTRFLIQRPRSIMKGWTDIQPVSYFSIINSLPNQVSYSVNLIYFIHNKIFNLKCHSNYFNDQNIHLFPEGLHLFHANTCILFVL